MRNSGLMKREHLFDMMLDREVLPPTMARHYERIADRSKRTDAAGEGLESHCTIGPIFFT
jgi:hypothetical protein